MPTQSNSIRNYFKENWGTIVTAVIAVIYVAYYLMAVIPENEETINEHHKNELVEFNERFYQVLKDYANAAENNNVLALKSLITDKKNSIHKSLLGTADNKKELRNSLILLEEVENELNSKECIIIKNIEINSLKNKHYSVEIENTTHFKIDKHCINEDIELTKNVKELLTLKTYTTIQKSDLKKRLLGASDFKEWMISIISSPDSSKKESDFEKTTLLTQNIDALEGDSLRKISSKSGPITFKFSNKRFYKSTFLIKETDISIAIVGAVDNDTFVSESQKLPPAKLILCVVVIILMFISIPLIKPLISSKHEKLSQFDLMKSISCVGILVVILTCYVFSNFLSGSKTESLKKELSVLNDSINLRFTSEVKRFSRAIDTIPHFKNPDIPFLKLRYYYPEFKDYPGLKTFFMMNEEGDITADFDISTSLRKNYSDRDYLKILKTSFNYRSAFSAVFSKHDNQYEAIYVKKDPGTKNVLGVAYNSNLGINVDSLIDFGYLICDSEGKVILHCDSTKNLNENFYKKCGKPKELLNLLNTGKASPFKAEYYNEPYFFYGRKLVYDTLSNPAPIYLFTYKKLNFENDLLFYSSVGGFLIAIAYAFIITLLCFIYSMFFYTGHIPLFSRYHMYWTFPDNSRHKEYSLLRAINYGFCLCVIIMLISGWKHLLYFTFITGINLTFFNFVLLNQRVFLFNDAGTKTKRITLLISLVLTIILSQVLSSLLYGRGYIVFGLSLSLFFHFGYLFVLRNRTNTKKVFGDMFEKNTVPVKSVYVSFLTSFTGFHYLIVPIIITFMVFTIESSFIDSCIFPSKTVNQRGVIHNNNGSDIFNCEALILQNLPLTSPVKKLLDDKGFTTLQSRTDYCRPNLFLTSKKASLYLALAFLFIIALAYSLTRFYSFRFFFFELSEAYRVGFFKTKHPNENRDIIIPPFDLADLEILEKKEKFKEDAYLPVLSNIPDTIIPASLTIDLIVIDNLQQTEKSYHNIWADLTDEEKFTLHDFALDHFVNYKNKANLIKLMHKGLIVPDKLTGRLKLMNYTFKNYVMLNAMNDKAVIDKTELAGKGVYEKWRVPLLILATTVLLLVIYLNKQSFDNFLVVGGSLISAVGLIARFLENYKKP